jgi:hypothetical protein
MFQVAHFVSDSSTSRHGRHPVSVDPRPTRTTGRQADGYVTIWLATDQHASPWSGRNDDRSGNDVSMTWPRTTAGTTRGEDDDGTPASGAAPG